MTRTAPIAALDNTKDSVGADTMTGDMVAADTAFNSEPLTQAEPAEEFVYHRNCSAAGAAGAAQIHEGEPG